MSEKLQEAILLYNKGDKPQALKLLAEIVKQEPNNSVAWYGLSLCLDDLDKKVYCLKRVLSLDPSHKKAQQILEKLQVGEKSPNFQKTTEPQSLPVTKKEASFNWLTASILGVGGMILIGVIIIGVALIGMDKFKPVPTPIPPTRTPRPSPTPSIFTGEPINYFPILPDRFEIDYSIKQIDMTLSDGTRRSSIGFRNKEPFGNGDLISVVYFIDIYTSESKAVSEYQKYIKRLEADEGSIDSDIGIDGADASAIYIYVKEDNVFEGQYISRIKNVVIVNIGLTTYDPQTITEAFMEDFMAEFIKVQILSINKLSK